MKCGTCGNKGTICGRSAHVINPMACTEADHQITCPFCRPEVGDVVEHLPSGHRGTVVSIEPSAIPYWGPTIQTKDREMTGAWDTRHWRIVR